MTFRLASLETVRRTIADCWLGRDAPVIDAPPVSPERLGTIALHPHQSDAAHQLADLLQEHGGAVLADAVGMGKTYVALALARQARQPLVVCPAALRALWQESAAASRVEIAIVSMEALSRSTTSAAAPVDRLLSRRTASAAARSAGSLEREWLTGGWDADLVVVDEAHHFRNPHTRRYHALARLTTRSRLLLLTATPVHNRADDLAALLGFFLGARAWALTDDERSRFVVRRDHAAIRAAHAKSIETVDRPPELAAALGFPTVVGPCVVPVGDDAATLDAIVRLPPPVPPADGETAAALTAMGLVRQWASSAGALRAALRRRLERATAVQIGLEQGIYPSYRDLRELCLGDGTIQLAFPEILLSCAATDAAHTGGPARREAPDTLLAAVRQHVAAVRALLEDLAVRPSMDGPRIDRLRAIARAHAGSQVIAFSAFEDTVHALYRGLRSDPGVCALSARGGLIASGPVGRSDVLRQFAPDGRTRTRQAERVDLLIATDLVSEGLNLHGAAVVVHLDLPWTPARLEQRVGRVARLGSRHRSVYVYALAPPAASEVVLQMERRLRAKLDAAGRAVGIAGSIVPPTSTICLPECARPPRLQGLPSRASASRDRIVGLPEYLAIARAAVQRWATSGPRREAGDAMLWAACCGSAPGLLAACRAGGRGFLVALHEGRVSEAPLAIARAVQAAEGLETRCEEACCQEAIGRVRAWWAERCAAEDMGQAVVGGGATSRRRVLSRIAAISRRCPAHARPTILALGERARQAAVAPLGVGGELALAQLAQAALPDVQWLRAVAAFAEASTAARGIAPAASGRHLEVIALVVFTTALGSESGGQSDADR